MIIFQDPDITDRAWVEERFRASGNQGCEYSFATLYLWSQAYRQQAARMDGYVLERLQGSLGPAYLFPAGTGPLEPVLDALERGGLSPLAVVGAATIDRKGEEPGLLEFCRERGWPLALFSPEELGGAPGSFSASPFVREVTGVDNVCERSAVLAAGGPLLIPKTALDGVTAAAASREVVLDLTLPGEKKGE